MLGPASGSVKAGAIRLGEDGSRLDGRVSRAVH
jgi:hypothetical protein